MFFKYKRKKSKVRVQLFGGPFNLLKKVIVVKDRKFPKAIIRYKWFKRYVYALDPDTMTFDHTSKISVGSYFYRKESV